MNNPLCRPLAWISNLEWQTHPQQLHPRRSLDLRGIEGRSSIRSDELPRGEVAHQEWQDQGRLCPSKTEPGSRTGSL